MKALVFEQFGEPGEVLELKSVDRPPLEENDEDPLTAVTELYISATGERAGKLDWHLAEETVGRSDGIPVSVGRGIKNAATSAASE